MEVAGEWEAVTAPPASPGEVIHTLMVHESPDRQSKINHVPDPKILLMSSADGASFPPSLARR